MKKHKQTLEDMLCQKKDDAFLYAVCFSTIAFFVFSIVLGLILKP